jgi:hypothetical protein
MHPQARLSAFDLEALPNIGSPEENSLDPLDT